MPAIMIKLKSGAKIQVTVKFVHIRSGYVAHIESDFGAFHGMGATEIAALRLAETSFRNAVELTPR